VLHYGKPGTGLELTAGMTFTIEPMINAGRREVRLLPTLDGGHQDQSCRRSGTHDLSGHGLRMLTWARASIYPPPRPLERRGKVLDHTADWPYLMAAPSPSKRRIFPICSGSPGCGTSCCRCFAVDEAVEIWFATGRLGRHYSARPGCATRQVRDDLALWLSAATDAASCTEFGHRHHGALRERLRDGNRYREF